MADYGIKLGDDTATDTNAELNLTSKYSSLKLFKWGDAQFTTDGGGEGSVVINHDLGYAPMVVVWRKLTTQYTFLSANTYANSFMLDGCYNSYAPTDNNIVSVISVDADDLTISNFPAIGFPLSGGNQASTTYYFRYMILVDLSQAFSDASNISLTGDYGFKVSKSGKSVLTAEEYDMNYSSKYKAIQYYDNHLVSSSLTLPAMWASEYDTSVAEATYVDFNHSLGYEPYFMVFTDYGGSNWYPIPVLELFNVYESGISGLSEVSAWCDDDRIRVLFNRESYFKAGVGGTTKVFSASTINIKCLIFAEDLTGSASP